MTDLLFIYRWTFLAGVIVAPALSILGAHLATRDKAMQTICIGQGGSVGVLLGLLLSHLLMMKEHDIEWVPFLFSIIFASFTFFISEKLTRKRASSRNSHFAALFACLLANGYLLSAVFPELEHHMVQVFVGDLATLCDEEATSALCLGFGLLFLLIYQWKDFSFDSFKIALFDDSTFLRKNRLFNFITLLATALSVQFLGFLFSVASLFLPTVIASFIIKQGLKRHYLFVAILSVLSTLLGFLASLYFSRLPTVPTIVTVELALGLILFGVQSIRVRI